MLCVMTMFEELKDWTLKAVDKKNTWPIDVILSIIGAFGV